MLGWPDLRIYQHNCVDDGSPTVTTWYESGQSDGQRSDFFLQINESPQGQALTYVGAIYAMRYRICSGWHRFKLSDSIEGVAPWLHRRWYDTLVMRRQFRSLHPECDNYSWARIRTQGPPYSQDDIAIV